MIATEQAAASIQFDRHEIDPPIDIIQIVLGHEMARVFAEMQQSLASSERIFSLLDANPDVADRLPSPTPSSASPSAGAA